ncbi:MAG: SAF domain-containing protein [Methylacidiphilales bacterium]|nr:SAF domain-containing protein [Candidatus Methylacidiphilales bacterium]
MKSIRIVLALIGILITVGAFAGFIVFASLFSPPPATVLVYNKDLNFGDIINEGDITSVEVSNLPPSLLRLYASPRNQDAVIGFRLLAPVARGEPVMITKLASPNNFSRYAAILTDTRNVIMSIPIRPQLIPPKIGIGDKVNLMIIIESGGFDVVITPSPTPFAGFGQPVPPTATPVPDDVVLEPTPTITATPVVLFPISDVILEAVPVIDVRRALVENPNFGVGGDNRRFIEGDIEAIILVVPREYQNVINFAVATDRLRISLSSPFGGDYTKAVPVLPISLDVYGKLYRFKMEDSIQRGIVITHTLYERYFELFYPEIHAAIIATREAWISRPGVERDKDKYMEAVIMRYTPTPVQDQSGQEAEEETP